MVTGVSSPQTPVTPNIPQQVGLGVMMAPAIRALTAVVFPPLRPNAIKVFHHAFTLMVTVISILFKRGPIR